MTNTIAKIRKGSKIFEIMVDMDEALKFKKDEINFIAPETNKVFTDMKKGNTASTSELKTAFGTNDVNEICKIIIKQGEVLVNQEHRDEEKEKKFKQVVDFLSRNAIDPKSEKPHSIERLKSALEQAHVNVKNIPIENQIEEILSQINAILPIKIETKKIKIKVPAIHTGKAYGIISQYKEEENWLNDGSLEVVIKIPAGLIMDFYDKLNSVTHGSAIAEEIKEK
jgi:ribosome maturation protein SDO1